MRGARRHTGGVAFLQSPGAAREDEMAADVDAARQHAQRAVGVGHEERVRAAAVGANRHRLANVLARSVVEARVLRVGGEPAARR